MFDFIYSEVWAMNTIIASVISAVVALVVGYLTANARFAKHDVSMDKDFKAVLERQNTTKEFLSKEHDGLSSANKQMFDKIDKVKDVADYLKTEVEKADAVKKVLPQQELNLTDMLNHMTAIIEDNAKLRAENLQARQEIQQLKQELENVKENIQEKKRRYQNSEYELEL